MKSISCLMASWVTGWFSTRSSHLFTPSPNDGQLNLKPVHFFFFISPSKKKNLSLISFREFWRTRSIRFPGPTWWLVVSRPDNIPIDIDSVCAEELIYLLLIASDSPWIVQRFATFILVGGSWHLRVDASVFATGQDAHPDECPGRLAGTKKEGNELENVWWTCSRNGKRKIKAGTWWREEKKRNKR